VEATPKSLEEVKLLGALALLGKPITMPLLVQTIKSALGESSAEPLAVERAKKLTSSGFSGRCPRCRDYNNRIRSELVNYADDAAQEVIVSRSRVFTCNACKHIWTETIDAEASP
jgi:hypothetical protein